MNALPPRLQMSRHYDFRTVFISDLHLGTRGCRSDFLADFLRRTSCENLFLVGDVIDGWRLRSPGTGTRSTTRCCG
jgi:UDP-2,3-diacylglucosamine pyrophosphatase LpxH